MSETISSYEGWALLELLGHRRLAGRVTGATIAGAAPAIRVDVYGPDDVEPRLTQYYAPGSFYALTPLAEALCRRFAEAHTPAPVRAYELPGPGPVAALDDDPDLIADDDDEEDPDDWDDEEDPDDADAEDRDDADAEDRVPVTGFKEAR